MQNPSATRINILTLPHPVKTEYKYVRDFCKTLHSTYGKGLDVIIHLGEARGWHHLTIERVAYKQGMSSNWWDKESEQEYYTMADDAGLSIGDIGPCPWDGVPMGLRSALDPDKLADGANTILKALYRFGKPGAGIRDAEHADGQLPRSGPAGNLLLESTAPIEIRPHSEGGPYLCGFINYESLANRYVRKLKANVLFCHIPGEADQVSLKRTGDGILAIVVSAAREVLLQKAQ